MPHTASRFKRKMRLRPKPWSSRLRLVREDMGMSDEEPMITPAMKREFDALLDVKGCERFRRSELAVRLYAKTNPRSHSRADKLAELLIQDAARHGKIVRTGHLHWMRVQATRVLKSGRTAADLPELVSLSLQTRCPEKWLSIDMESGEIWLGSQSGWRRAPASVTVELRALLENQ